MRTSRRTTARIPGPERIWERQRAEAIASKCAGKAGSIEEEKKPTTQVAPLLYDLTTLQRDANTRFSLSARRTLQIVQTLYERHKVLTYPRTDSRYLPEDYIGNAKAVLTKFEDQELARARAKGAGQGMGKTEQAHLQRLQGDRPPRHHSDRSLDEESR